MATLPLAPVQIETVFQQIIQAMGLNLSQAPAPVTGPNNYGVRIEWQTQGQPFQKITEDVVYLRCVEEDDVVNRVRDLSYPLVNGVPTQTINYTRVWRTYWSVYGPNSFDNARLIRSRLFDQDIHDLCSASKLYFVTDPTAPQYLKEYENGQWWERTDFSARFNEFVTEQQPANFVASAELIVKGSLGNPIEDVTL